MRPGRLRVQKFWAQPGSGSAFYGKHPICRMAQDGAVL